MNVHVTFFIQKHEVSNINVTYTHEDHNMSLLFRMITNFQTDDKGNQMVGAVFRL